jgi:hypothetical protein
MLSPITARDIITAAVHDARVPRPKRGACPDARVAFERAIVALTDTDAALRFADALEAQPGDAAARLLPLAAPLLDAVYYLTYEAPPATQRLVRDIAPYDAVLQGTLAHSYDVAHAIVTLAPYVARRLREHIDAQRA